MPPSNDSLADFRALLREIFQFDVADLDFGIYRVLNHKRDAIERFIDRDLVAFVRDELEAYEAGRTDEFEQEAKEAQAALVENLGPGALDDDGNVPEAFRATPAAKRYLAAKQKLKTAEMSVDTERRIYDDLTRFFRRYYDAGDFVSKRRFAARDPKYMIPYNGEEVLLHWANRDQYYIKTSEHFADYRFEKNDVHVHFKLVDAQVPKDNVKASDTRYFVLQGEAPVTAEEDEDGVTLVTLHFAFRPLTEAEDEALLNLYNEEQTKSNRRKTTDRSVIVAGTAKQILAALEAGGADATTRATLAQPLDDGDGRSLLERHLGRYTAKNTSDYFVHKDLGGFLRGQLDFFVQNEVVRLDDVLNAGEGATRQAIDRARVVRRVGRRIIAFLAQVEDFQKRLFEKRKFVLETGYCATLDRVPEDLYDAVLACDAQLDAWRDLYALGDWDDGLFGVGKIDAKALAAHPHLMIDTRHFDQAFTDRLLAHLSTLDDEGGLDGVVDGVCIQSENFQALNLLQATYRERVQCVYIDPPYNTGGDGFLYKDSYPHSSWLSMMADRYLACSPLLRTQGAVFTSIDDDEAHRLVALQDSVIGAHNHVANVIWQKKYTRSNDASHFSDNYDYITVYFNSHEELVLNRLPRTEKQDKAYTNPDNDPRGPWKSTPLQAMSGTGEGFEHTFPNGVTWSPPEGRYSAYSPDKLDKLYKSNEIWFGVKGTATPSRKTYLSDVSGLIPLTIWPHEECGHNHEAVEDLKGLFSINPYSSPKPVRLLNRVLLISTSEEDVVLDYFAGSGTTGHAVIDLNREDDGARRYVLVEMGDYFDTVLLPRLKKAVFASDWKDGVPQSRDGVSHVIRYHRLESYEDTLDNLEVEGAQFSLMDRFDDYALHYMLPHETRESETLLTMEAFERPFDYTLKVQRGMARAQVHTVDLEATFNYLIGLRVATRTVHEHQGRRYVVVTGTVEDEQAVRDVVVVWRNRDGLDLDAEADWWAEEDMPTGETIYVNGPSHLPGAEPLEIPFRTRMDPAVA
jgi:adenine-specific DNA-methyltransferase